MLNYCQRYYTLPNNVAQLDGSMESSSADAMQIWTLDEYKLFRTHAVKTPARIAFDILYWSGIREGEFACTDTPWLSTGSPVRC